MNTVCAKTTDSFSLARFHMVESQLRPNKVTDLRVLDAMGTVPRELFVPAARQSVAYVDEDVEIAPGRFLMEPMVFARLAQEARLAPGDRILDIGCGSGYSTAILAHLGDHVIAVESDQGLAVRAAENLGGLEIKNAGIAHGALLDGYPEQGPYQAILLNGMVAAVPEALLAQLAEGGRLAAVVAEEGRVNRVGRACLYEKANGAVSSRPLFDANTPFLPGCAPVRSFEL